MNRKEVAKEIIAIKSPYILTELPTGFGKTAIALQWMAKKAKTTDRILIVVPRLVLIDTWKDEIRKWKKMRYINSITFTTYVSFPKVANQYKVVIFDEVHHLSQRCQNALDDFIIDNAIMLSATVTRPMRESLQNLFKGLVVYKKELKDAIKDEILPDPKVLLIPLHLDNRIKQCSIIKNKGKGKRITIDYKDRWKVKTKTEIEIACTQQQYYDDLCNLIEFYKRKSFNYRMEKMYLLKCNERLKWLAEQKTVIVKAILDKYADHRTLTFCANIEHTELLGKYCINSKNKKSHEYLDMFNNHKINHITACSILDEGANLVDCQIGIFAMINSSDKLILQRTGRILRHKEPIIIIPYFVNTREAEIVEKMKQNYNEDLIEYNYTTF